MLFLYKTRFNIWKLISAHNELRVNVKALQWADVLIFALMRKMLTKPNYPFPIYIYGLKLIAIIEGWVSYVTLFFDMAMIYFNVSQFK